MKNGNRILTCALALSLAVHVLFAIVFRPGRAIEAHPEQTPLPIGLTVIHTPPPPTPTPAPTVPPVSPPKPAVAAQPVHPPHTINRPDAHGSGEPAAPRGPVTGPIGPPGPPGPQVATGSPEPTATPKPACSVPNVPASAVEVVAPTIPESADYAGDAQAQVRVTLQPTGAIEAVALYRTAGNPALDREALRAARQSTYRAEIRNCVAVAGDYLFTVDFKE